MKAKLFAVCLSLSFLSCFANAANLTNTTVAKNIQVAHDKIHLNSASVSELTNSFKGIGEKRAQNIVDYRNKQGKFKQISDLSKVKGIGQKFVEKNLRELADTFLIE